MLDPIPKRVLIGVLISALWQVVTIVIWIVLGVYKSNYYSFGPSENLVLAFVNIEIDTWYKYIILMFYIVFNCVFTALSGNYVSPWVNSCAMNPDYKLNYKKVHVYAIVNSYWGLYSLSTIFFFLLNVAQVDFAIVICVSNIMTDLYSSYQVIFDEKRNYDSSSEYTTIN
jgi:hypothetical protein